MASMKVSEFMLQLVKELQEKKEITESSASAYLKSLYYLNNKQPFKTLTFLKKTDDVLKIIDGYADNTKKSLLTAVSSVLSLYKDKPTYKKVYQFYFDKLMGKAAELKKIDTAEKTEKQKENWVEWEEVKHKKEELESVVREFSTQKAITPEQYEKLLHYVVLSLYTEIQPRRNQDYLDMYVVKKWSEEMPKDKNYLDLAGGKVPTQFIFNKYKTAKSFGTQIEKIPDTLSGILSLYLKYHPLNRGSRKPVEFKFLVNEDGSSIIAVNAITRILNKVFGKKVGSSMLRHSYLSGKYDVDEMKKDATAMAHSMSTQRTYIKRDDPNETTTTIQVPTTVKPN